MPHAIAADGTRLYYETLGAGDPLLLVSGQGYDHHMWDGVRADFARHYQVIVFDYRGTGASDKPTEPEYTTRGLAGDAIAILDHLGFARAHAYGISMGGRVCQWLAIDHPQRLGALVLGATSPGNAHGVRRPAEVDLAFQQHALDPDQSFAILLDTLYTPAWIAAHSNVVALIRAHPPIPPFAQRLHYLASEGHDAWDLLPSITAPTLVIHGSDDMMNVIANAHLLAGRIPGAQLHIIAGARHGYADEFRAEASRVVLDFLARHPV